VDHKHTYPHSTGRSQWGGGYSWTCPLSTSGIAHQERAGSTTTLYLDQHTHTPTHVVERSRCSSRWLSAATYTICNVSRLQCPACHVSPAFTSACEAVNVRQCTPHNPTHQGALVVGSSCAALGRLMHWWEYSCCVSCCCCCCPCPRQLGPHSVISFTIPRWHEVTPVVGNRPRYSVSASCSALLPTNMPLSVWHDTTLYAVCDSDNNYTSRMHQFVGL